LLVVNPRVSVGGFSTVSPTVVVAVELPLAPVIVMFEAPAAAVLATVRVAVALAPGLTLAGLKLRVTPAGVLAVRFTVPLNPPVALTATVKAADFPGNRDSDAAEVVKVNPAGVVTEPEPGQPFTSRFASTDPRPVARL